MLRVHCFGFAFTPKLIPTIFLLVCLPILIALGSWQWHRADQKQQLLDQFQQTTTLQLTDLSQQSLKSLNYRRIQITGRYDNRHQLLLDNKIYQHRVGFEVLTPFVPADQQQIILVNRGWIAGNGRRNPLPKIPAIEGQQTIQGFIKVPKKHFALGRSPQQNEWPRLIQTLDIKQIQKAYDKPLHPFVILLSPQSPNGFVRQWRPTIISPQKHISYAIQWFALALTLVIIYFVLSIKRQRGRHDTKTE